MPKTKITQANKSGPSAPYSAGNVITGQTTVATATECVQITTETFAPHGIMITTKDASTFFIGNGQAAGTDLSGVGIQIKTNNQLGYPIFIDDPSGLMVDCIADDKDISWLIF